MTEFNLIVSSLVLAILLPVSVAVLFALLAAHVQLAPESPMHSAVLERFDSEPDRAGYHAAVEAERQLRSTAVTTRYRQEMERQLDRMDPRQAEPYRRALSAATVSGQTADAHDGKVHDESSTPGATQLELPSTTSPDGEPRRRRPTLWRTHLASLHQ